MFKLLSDFRLIAAFKHCHFIVGLQFANKHHTEQNIFFLMSAASLSVVPVNKILLSLTKHTKCSLFSVFSAVYGAFFLSKNGKKSASPLK